MDTKVLPTQFIMIDTYPYRFLLKPFSIADFDNGICKIIYRTISDGTKFLSTKQKKEEIKFLGPLGNFEKFKNIKIKPEDNIVILAGGSGVAGMIFVYKYLSKITNNIKFFYGEKEKDYIINLSDFGIKNNVIYSTDDGSFAEKGFVTEVFYRNYKNFKIDYLFLCGPKQMIKSIQKSLKNKSYIKAYVLLEEYMCCGIGLCRSCVVKVKDKNDWIYQTVCKEGPMFELDNVLL
ncbi:MAG: hypothetical protein ACK4WJ_02755 [Endomicrobiia bacterium]